MDFVEKKIDNLVALLQSILRRPDEIDRWILHPKRSKTMDFVLKTMWIPRFCIQNDDFCIENDEICIGKDGFSIENDEICIENDGFSIENDGLCTKMMNSVFTLMDFVLKLMDFVLKWWILYLKWWIRRQPSAVLVFCTRIKQVFWHKMKRYSMRFLQQNDDFLLILVGSRRSGRSINILRA